MTKVEIEDLTTAFENKVSRTLLKHFIGGVAGLLITAFGLGGWSMAQQASQATTNVRVESVNESLNKRIDTMDELGTAKARRDYDKWSDEITKVRLNQERIMGKLGITPVQ